MALNLENVFTCLLWLLASFIATQLLVSLFKRNNLPPGPVGWPVVGNLLQLGRNAPRQLAQLSAKFGPVMSLRLGTMTTIVVSSASATKELLQSHDASLRDREMYDAITAQRHHEFSPIWMPGGPQWRRLRSISNAHLFSKKSLDNTRILRATKVKELVSYVRACCDDVVPIDIGQAAFDTGLNFMSNTIFSIDLADPNSETAREFKQLIWEMSAEVGTPNIADHFPVLKALDPQGIRRRMNRHFGKTMDLINGLIDQRLENLKPDDEDGDFDDVLATLIKISRDPDSGIDRSYIVHLLMDLFFGGTETTGNTIEWAMAELLHNPEKMKTAREELHTTIGKQTVVTETNISNLPYMQAIVKETLRLHPPIPLISRKNTHSDLGLSGFTVPKNSRVWINVYGIGRDPKVWPNPEEFKPERFLGPGGVDVMGRDFEVIPFGSGRRICVGMSLALRMVPLSLASLIHSFDWKVENGASMDMEEKFGLTMQKAVPLRAIPINL